ncbi:TA system VapC family ribonuclease toxin [Synechococcus sp. CB0205]|uniref:TA system VapC family ribonuclease toxin n=1 Tax=Synechococcus sp. CB0205 TaxID=232363 RepID=UPI0002002481|nr:TA system VapC family ribonuclease toxin [Synechococcus sp. CB0205]
MRLTTALLDVNVLIALLDPHHVHHELCHGWFADRGAAPWASCAMTQNAVLRILGNPRYPISPGPPPTIAPHLDSLVEHPGHEFWDSNPSLLSQGFIARSALIDYAQITDLYLLALARHHGGTLATLDKRIKVDGSQDALELIRP